MTFPFPMMAKSSKAAPSITFQSIAAAAPGSTAVSFTSQSFGAVASNRIIIIALAGIAGGGGSPTWSGVTIGGIAATQQINTNSAAGVSTAIFTAAVPTGSTGTVAATCSVAMTRVGLTIWSAYNLASSGTAANTAGSTAGTASMNINTLAGDVLVVAGHNNNQAAPGATPTGYTERYDSDPLSSGNTWSGGDFTATVSETPRTVTLTWASSGNQTASVASFR